MTKNIQWPDLTFPPINLYNVPKQTLHAESNTNPYASKDAYPLRVVFRQDVVQSRIKKILDGTR